MSSDSLTDAPAPRAGTWFGFLGGALAWLLHLIAVWAIAEFGCLGGPGAILGGAMTAVALWLIVATLACAAVAVASTLVAYRAQGMRRSTSSEGDDKLQDFLARGGVVMSALFAFIIVIQGVPIFYFLDWC